MRTWSCLTVLLAAGASMATAQQFDSTTSRVVVPGVIHRRLVANAEPWVVNVLTVDLRRPGIAIGALRAHDRYDGRERVTDMVRRHAMPGAQIVAAVNGDLFDLATGATENDGVVAGAIVKGTPFTDTRMDAFRNAHSQFAVTRQGRPLIDRFTFHGWLTGAFLDVAIRGVNVRPASEPNAVVLYDGWIGDRTPADSAATSAGAVAEVALRERRSRGDTLWLRADTTVNGAGLALPLGGYVLAGYGSSTELVRRLRGHDVRAVLSFRPDRGPLRTLVGGWGRLIEDGLVVADSVDQHEGTPPSFSVTRHPRTGVGFSRDSSTLYLVTVDGRSESSSGMPLVEFARLFQQLGAFQAMNLDGGGSTTMVIGSALVNTPSDQEGERPVGNALIVTMKR